MKYLIYQITHIPSGMIYIGCHRTSNVNDGYMGSGIRILNAIKCYGESEFHKEILHVYDNEDDMINKERELVNEEFVSRHDTYNIALGGYGGGYYLHHLRLKSDEEYKREFSSKVSLSRIGMKFSLTHKENLSSSRSGFKHSSETIFKMSKPRSRYKARHRQPMTGKSHSEESKNKIRESNIRTYSNSELRKRLSESHKGDRNPTTGSKWISNLDLHVNKRCKLDNLEKMLQNGWQLGRVSF